MPKSIWDTRFTRAKPPMALDAAVVDALFALDDWITIHGAHVEIDGDGNVLHGAGGKFNGTNYYRHMNEKARAEKGEIHNDFNKAEYKKTIKDAIDKKIQAVERQAVVDRENDFIGWKIAAGLRERDLQEARDRGLTRRGLMKYERSVQDARDQMDKYRTPEELDRMAKAAEFGDEKAKYREMAAEAREDIENRTREKLPLYLEAAGLNVHGDISTEGSRKDAINDYIDRNANDRSAERESELLKERANIRIAQLYESGQYPKEVELHANEYGEIQIGGGGGLDEPIVETTEQVKQATKNYGKPYDAQGQKSIFGGSGWW